MGHHDHERLAQKSLKVAVLTLSDTRNFDSDKSGKLIKDILEASGHEVAIYDLIKEEPGLIKATMDKYLQENIDALITNGGTGLTARDGTVEVARELFEKELEGFGEIFRLISYQQIGAAAMLSRSCAGMTNKKIIVCLPGSSKAVKLAMERLIIPQLPHMVWEANR